MNHKYLRSRTGCQVLTSSIDEMNYSRSNPGAMRRARLPCYTISMEAWEARPFRNYKWIVSDPALLGGKLAIRGTRFSVSFILACLAEGMSVEEIENEYAPFPRESIPEIMKVASELLDSPHVAA
jgi:uncharacterized protein (DUF433 family)